METVTHPVTYNTIGTVEKSECGQMWFAQVVDGENDHKQLSEEAVFRSKRSAVAWINRKWKQIKSNA